jgi:hypothetical protein
VLGPGASGTYDNGYAGISTVFKAPNGDFYGFYEAEDQEGLGTIPGTSIPGFYARVGLASSADGLHWTRDGYVIEDFLPKRTPNGIVPFAQGTATPGSVASADGASLYVYYDEHSGEDGQGNPRPVAICMARAELGSWPPAIPASPGPIAGFSKYRDGQFSTPGVGGVDSPVVRAPIDSAAAFQAHVVRSGSLNGFVMIHGVDAWAERTLTGIPRVSGIYAAFSDDAIHWQSSGAPIVTDFANLWANESVSWEASILWESGSDTTGWLVYASGEAPPPSMPGVAPSPHMVGRRVTVAREPASDEGTSKPPWPVCAPVANHACGTIGQSCPVPDPSITDPSNVGVGGRAYGVGDNVWGTFSIAASGQMAPTVTATEAGLSAAANLSAPAAAGQDWAIAGLYFAETNCLDASTYTGVRFTISGDLGACSLNLSLDISQDLSTQADPGRGSCTASLCYPPLSDVTAKLTPPKTTITVPFTALAGGSPVTTFDASAITSVKWGLLTPAGGGGCSATFTVSDVTFVR